MNTVNDFEEVVLRALLHLRMVGMAEIPDPEADYYLTFGDERFNITTRPEPAIGSLADDLSELSVLAESNRSVTAVDLDRIAEVFHFLSDELSGR